MFERVQFQVDGMGCGACVANVRAALDQIPGVLVEAVHVGSARLRRDPGQVSDQAIVQALAASGYSARKEASNASDSCCTAGSACADESR